MFCATAYSSEKEIHNGSVCAMLKNLLHGNGGKRPLTLLREQIPFGLLIGALLIVSALIFDQPELAMWFGFAIAGYSAIANDSIQTLGTFLTSNKHRKRWVLWAFIAGILVITHVYGWFTEGGSFAFGRLESIPQPTDFTFLALSAPIILLILTRLKMPVSTTFLILSTFSSTVVIQKMLMKTFVGYILAFGIALLVWGIVGYVMRVKKIDKKKPKPYWYTLQMLSTGFLWSMWLMQDTANIAVFLPRQLTGVQVTIAIAYLVGIIGVLMYWRGGGIQTIVEEKTDIVDARAATVIDFTYAIILLVFKIWSHVPMSTTWVFLGLLAGREIALMQVSRSQEPYRTTAKMVLRDIARAGIGLLISLVIVLFITS